MSSSIDDARTRLEESFRRFDPSLGEAGAKAAAQGRESYGWHPRSTLSPGYVSRMAELNEISRRLDEVEESHRMTGLLFEATRPLTRSPRSVDLTKVSRLSEPSRSAVPTRPREVEGLQTIELSETGAIVEEDLAARFVRTFHMSPEAARAAAGGRR